MNGDGDGDFGGGVGAAAASGSSSVFAAVNENEARLGLRDDDTEAVDAKSPGCEYSAVIESGNDIDLEDTLSVLLWCISSENYNDRLRDYLCDRKLRLPSAYQLGSVYCSLFIFPFFIFYFLTNSS